MAAPATTAVAPASHAAGAGATAPANIRNLVLTGHTGSGKTTLVERILFHSKAIAKMGSVLEGNTVCDFDAEAKHHKHTLSSSIAHARFDGKLLNLIDTPGAADFFGHVVSVFSGAELVAVVVDGAKGVEVTTRRVMKIAAELGLPRLLIVNKIDHDCDLPALLDSIQESFGTECIPINLPIKNNTDVIDVFEHDHAEAGAEPSLMTVKDAHTHIYEQIVEMDESLTAEYFEKGDKLDPAKVHAAMEAALRAGHLIPVCFCSGKTGAGIDDLLHILVAQCPSPLECVPPHVTLRDASGNEQMFEPAVGNAGAPTVAHVFKVINDPFMGKLSVLRVLQGTVKSKSELYHGDSKKPVRIGHLFKLQGKEHMEVDHLAAGDIGVIPKVDELRFNSVLHSDPAQHFNPPRLPIPRPLFGIAVELKNPADEAKFSNTVHKLMEEDPCFSMERVAATGQTVLRGLGDLHLRIMLERLKGRSNIDLETKPTKVAYKETILIKADGHARHKKQTGGAGQFGEVYLRVEPLPTGHPEGFEFVNDTVGGSVPKQFMPAIEKGVRQVLITGAFAGFPLTGLRVAVTDGKHHPVDSKEVAFVAAGRKAFIDAISKARPALLEPYVAVEVTAPAGSMGDITADIAGTKRGRVQGSDVIPGNQCVIKAVVPLAELGTFSNELKSITGGQGTFSMEYSHDDYTPANIQAQIVAAFKPHHDED
ncbi:MAG: elongation factor G [Phycisphaerales bacterium]